MVSTTPLVNKAAAQEREHARLQAELEERKRRNRAIEEEKKRQEQVGQGHVWLVFSPQDLSRNTPSGRLVLAGLRRDEGGLPVAARGGHSQGEKSQKGICSLPNAGRVQ